MGGKKVLLIDDEPSVLTYLGAVLEDHGYETRQERDASHAEAAVRDEAPDLICMDIMMPQRSGLSFYQDLRRDPKTRAIPVVFVSAFSRKREFDEGVFRRILDDDDTPEPQGFVEKPIDVPAFLDVVESIIGPAGLDSGKE